MVSIATGGTSKPTHRREQRFDSDDEASAAHAKMLSDKRRGGYVDAGPCQVLEEASQPTSKGSALLIDAYFAAGDQRFIDELLQFDGVKKLAALAKPWFEDPRPFARRMLLAYVDDGCDRPGHKALAKRLFKLAEAEKDHELLGRFLVAFDRLNRRTLSTVTWKWDPTEGKIIPLTGLRGDPTVPEKLARGSQSMRFTRATRRYLARRAFRHFRHLGARNPRAYRQAIVEALASYREEHLSTVGRLLGSWGLMHVLYGKSEVLSRAPVGIRLAPGRSLAELRPAPLFPSAWEGGFADLLHLVLAAGSRPVRLWAVQMLRTTSAQALSELGLGQIKSLLRSPNEEAQALGIELFTKQTKLDALTLSDWLELLAIESLEVVSAVAERAVTALDPRRLDVEQCVELCLSPAAPVAQLGFDWCKTREISSETDLVAVLSTVRAKVPSIRRDAAAHCGELLRTHPLVRDDQVRDLCDAPFAEVRAAGLSAVSARFGESIALWTALSESPYPDVRSFVVATAAEFRQTSAETLRHVFGTVLLSLYGAAKDKRRVARELAERIASEPGQAPELLPLLGLALRSVHPAERGLALSTLARVMLRNPETRELMARQLPGIGWGEGVSQ